MSSDSSKDRPRPPAWSLAPSASNRDTLVFSDFALRGGSADIQLTEGETILGRSLDCGVVIDSPVVSRQHASIVIKGEDVVLRDLGSRNGVRLNGEEIESKANLHTGDHFTIGSIEFELVQREASLGDGDRETTVPPLVEDPFRPNLPPTHETTQASAFDLLQTVADKSLARGSSEEVIHLLGKHIARTHQTVLLGKPAQQAQVIAASSYAIRIAVAAKDVSWAVMALEMLDARRLIPAADRVDQLYSMVNVLRPHYDLVHKYTRNMGALREELSPTDRFALKRLDGLERLIALKK